MSGTVPPFLQDALTWARLTAGHFLLMFWWIWGTALALTALSESFWVAGRRRLLLERPDDGWRTVWLAVQLGVLSPPSRRRIFAQAKELLAAGVSRAGVLAYLVSAQSLLLWFLLFVVELNGPQPALGQLVAVAAALVVLLWSAGRLPEALWAGVRKRAREDAVQTGEARSGSGAEPERPGPLQRAGPAWLRPLKSVGGQAVSLGWPLLFGTLGIGFFLALGQSPGYLSLQGGKGALVQGGNAAVGLLAAYVTGAPLVGNALFAAGLWKAQFVTYAGLSAFYLGTLVMPFALPRYFELFGPVLAKKLLWRLSASLLIGALAATAWWWGLDALAGILGVRDWFEAFTASTLRPSDVPWFHHWFAPDI